MLYFQSFSIFFKKCIKKTRKSIWKIIKHVIREISYFHNNSRKHVLVTSDKKLFLRTDPKHSLMLPWTTKTQVKTSLPWTTICYRTLVTGWIMIQFWPHQEIGHKTTKVQLSTSESNLWDSITIASNSYACITQSSPTQPIT